MPWHALPIMSDSQSRPLTALSCPLPLRLGSKEFAPAKSAITAREREPGAGSSGSSSVPNLSVVEANLLAMGFGTEKCKMAVRVCGENLEAALQWIVEEGNESLPPAKVRRIGPKAAGSSGAIGGAGAVGAANEAGAAIAAGAPCVRRPAAAAAVVQPEAVEVRPAGGLASSVAGAGAGSSLKRTAPMGGDTRSLKRLMKELSQLQSLDAKGGSRRLHLYEAEPIDESDLCTPCCCLHSLVGVEEGPADRHLCTLSALHLPLAALSAHACPTAAWASP